MAKKENSTFLVIVESPAKARTLSKFLPKHFLIKASMGHVRDLPQSAADIPAKYKGEEWAKLGVNVENGFQPLYVVPKGKTKVIRELKADIKKADTLYLATDEDREGESISWHLLELLKPNIPVKRMVFHEITKEAIHEALDHTRDIDHSLVQAQETRRILDRLVGYTLSPLLWKKIAYGLSAGRVQSAGLRLIIDRERERIRFKKAAYWDLVAELKKGEKSFQAKLHSIDGTRITTGKDFDETTGKLKEGKNVLLLDETQAKATQKKLESAEWKVGAIEKKSFTSRPSPPFITSTLQQEANRKLGLSAKQTMRIAQHLYEDGFITYMRTDSLTLSQQAIQAAVECVKKLYGEKYLHTQTRQFKSKAKGAQEAHEAIRPAGSRFRPPDETGLTGKDLALYELIWKRTVATQMAEAKKESMSVKIEADNTLFSASGTRILFPGFIRVYVEGSDDPEAALEDKEVLLPDLKEGEIVEAVKLEALSHETKPPARFTEASLVKELEKDGIGRPSTYASIISTIIDRGYVRKIGNALYPTFTGFAVIQLLEKHFEDLVSYGFTADMEETLDEIAEGEKESFAFLQHFYLSKDGLRAQVEKKEAEIDPKASRTIHLEHIGGADIRIGRFGAYLERMENGSKEPVSVSIPEDIAPADFNEETLQHIFEHQSGGGEFVGDHPETGEKIYCLIGRYGPYLQVGEKTDANPKPRRGSVPKSIDYRKITLEQAVKILSLPRTLGEHPESKKPVVASVGRFGPYVMHDGDFRSIKKADSDVYSIQLAEALEILAQPKRGRGGAKLVREIGNHPDDRKSINIYEGRYGPYIKYKSKNVSIPKEKDPEKITLEEALALIAQKKGKKRR